MNEDWLTTISLISPRTRKQREVSYFINLYHIPNYMTQQNKEVKSKINCIWTPIPYFSHASLVEEKKEEKMGVKVFFLHMQLAIMIISYTCIYLSHEQFKITHGWVSS